MENSKQPAFPMTANDGAGNYYNTDGLTKREYIATASLQGLLANRHISMQMESIPGSGDNMGEIYARLSLEFADSLLEEMGKNPGK